MLLHLMRMSREFEWRNLKDRIYSMIGIIRSVRPDLNLAIIPDYSDAMTPAMVFTHFARSIIQHSDNLGIISQVSDPQDRQIADLPSWVPCFRLAPVYANGRKYPYRADASLPSMEGNICSFNGTSLQASGVMIGNITEALNIRLECAASILSLRKLAEDAVESQGICCDELLWRTMTWDICGMHGAPPDEYPAPEKVGIFYASWLHLAAEQEVRELSFNILSLQTPKEP